MSASTPASTPAFTPASVLPATKARQAAEALAQAMSRDAAAAIRHHQCRFALAHAEDPACATAIVGAWLATICNLADGLLGQLDGAIPPEDLAAVQATLADGLAEVLGTGETLAA